MKIENALDDTTEKLEAATLGLEEAEKQQLVNEEEVSALQRGSSFVNDERMDALEENITISSDVALKSTRNAEEVARKLAMTQVDIDRTTDKCKEAEKTIADLEEQLNVVGQNMKTL